ncbi:TIGR02677 family protein [Micromonospora sp. DR5-3]|uniref:TIGR02677 family protein n=1 Tax=unclassified Micromonospora TaxID=2617518 RepID=UPI0011D6BC85|nr:MULTISPECIES: TIGR02677 family protein [unclassified Micromonospora]MCW3820734.1 TIGR02677 family protein [Micromonospora sp. DR5-3]TYC17209.1 TIGR02677 family protein [Micromonospora sp. MP36]
MFAFTTTDRADLHTAVMQVFGDAHERLVAALTFDEILAALPGVGWYEPVADSSLDYTLGALHKYGLVERTQNHSAHYASAAEYERRNLHYSLSRKGEAAYEGVLHAVQHLSSTGALQTAVLDAILDRLGELHDLLSADGSPDRRIYAALTELEGHLAGLRASTKQFNGQLQRLLRAEGTDPATFAEVKQATIAYLSEFVTNLDSRRHAIGDAVCRIQQRGVTVLHHRALRGADLPALPGDDPAPRWLELRAARWEGLCAWFQPADGTSPRIDQLADVARRAIVALMRALERLTDSRRRGTSTAADFRALARWFAASDSDDAAHELWSAAFGLWPARHTHLTHDDPTAVSATTSWWDAPAVPVSPLLRTTAQVDKVARTARVRDTAEVRRLRRDRVMAERVELERAWAQLATPGPVRLSAFAQLDPGSFARLLELLSRALSAPPRDGVRRAATADGRLVVALADADTARRAVLHTPHGVLSAPDLLVSISEARSPGGLVAGLTGVEATA